jgi:hypothetical protein
MNKKPLRPKRLLLNKETTKILTATMMAAVRGGVVTWPESFPQDFCDSACQSC